MNKLLKKISWKTRRINIKFTLFELLLHDNRESWGINFFCITKDFYDYSLFRFEFRLPNGTNVRRFSVDKWDFLFLSKFLWNEYDELSERYLWTYRDPEGWDRIKLNLLEKLFR